MNQDTGWEQEYRTHFNSIVTEYEAIRPEWPDKIFLDIDTYIKPGQGKNAVEIGIGTGKATAPFLNMGYSVTAVEINRAMAEYSSNRFQEYENLKVLTASFEEAVLDENAFDVIYAASAFHWVDAKIGLPKVLRLLKKGGAIALFRYNEVASVADELYQEIRRIHHQHFDRYHNLPYSPPIRKTHQDFYKPEEIQKGFRFQDLQSYGFQDVEMKFYDITLEYSADDYILLLETLSDHRNLPEAVKMPFYAETREQIEKSGGTYRVDYVFQLYLGRK